MDFFRTFIRCIKKFTFIPPKKSKVVILDPSGDDLFIKLITQNVDYSLLYTRFEIFYLHPLILLKIVKNSIFLHKEYKNFFNYLFSLYFFSCLEYINPKIVITYIDNSVLFQWLSRRYPNSDFYAIQNGIRIWELTETSMERKISMPNLICFGQNEIDQSKKHGHVIDNFFPVGSFKGSFFRYTVLKKPQEKQFDICFISQYRYSIMTGDEYPFIKKGHDILEQYLKRFAEKNSLLFCVALNSENTDEYEYFSKIFGNKVTLIRDSKKNIDGTSFSTYFAMDQSKVIVTLLSTAGIEAFGWGAKVLFCNFSGNESYNFTVEGINSINIPNYDIFEQKLLNLLYADDTEYLALTLTSRTYMMNYNPDLKVHEFVKNLISDSISSNKK
jgi:surface carbohydrate biosynthesis protein